MSFPVYPEYKDSGIAWIGEVPVGWQVWKIGHSFGGFGSGTTPPTSDEKWFSQGEIPWVTTGELRENIIVSTKKNLVGEALKAFPALQVHPRGSLVIAMYGATIGRLGVLGVPATTNQACCVLSEPISLAVRFTFYWLLVHREQIVSLFSSGGGQPNINRETITSLKVPAPNLNEQTQIARFLDHETANIDALIREQERLIELLQEKRQAVISHAVTKGLDPDVPMKDSGVEWLGEVPAHWEMVPLKYLCSFSGGGTPSKENLEYWNGDIPWVSPKDMKSFWISNSIDKITELAVAESSTSLVEPNALLMVVRSGILQRTIPVAVNTVEVTLNQDMKALRFSMEGFERYFAMLVQGFEPSWLLEWRKQGATVESIEQEYLAESLIPVPPRNEIYAIVNKVAAVAKRYESLEEEAHNSSQLLRERRSALISAAVTGKIDVRNWQPPADESAFDKEVRQAGMEATA